MKTKNYFLAAIITIVACLPTTAQTWLEKSMNGTTIGGNPPVVGTPNVYSEPLDTAWRLGNVGIGLPGWPLTKLHVGHNTDVTGTLTSILGGFGASPSNITHINMNGGVPSTTFTMGGLDFVSKSNEAGAQNLASMGMVFGDYVDQITAVTAFAMGSNNDETRGLQAEVMGDDNTQVSAVKGDADGDGNSQMYGVWGAVTGSDNTEFYGVYGTTTPQGSNMVSIGAFGQSVTSSPAYDNIGVKGEGCNGSNWNVGVWGVACATGTGSDWAGYFNGDVYCTGSYLPSDKKLKNNIRELNSGLEGLRKLPIYSYNFKSDMGINLTDPSRTQYGPLANELEAIYPELVIDTKAPNNDNAKEEVTFKAVNYIGLIPILVRSIQELDEKVTALEETNRRLEDRLNGNKGDAGAITSGITSNVAADAPSMKLMPNPTNDFMDIAVDYPTCNTCSLVITDLQGKLIKNVTLTRDGKYTIHKSEIGQGVYLCNLVIDGKYVRSERMVFL